MSRLITLSLLILLAAPAHAPAQAIQFQEIRTAMRQGVQQRKTIGVYFSADWCTWCQRMKTESFADPSVQNVSRNMVWAEVDVDDDPVIAAMFGVEGLPAIIFLNADGEMLGSHNGYIPPRELTPLVRMRAGQAGVPGERRQRFQSLLANADNLRTIDDQAQLAESVHTLLELAAEPHREMRDMVIDALREPRAWPALAAGLNNDRLAVRAAAADLLTTVTGQKHPFDPFAAPETRQSQARTWLRWIEQHAATAEPVADQPADQPTESPQ